MHKFLIFLIIFPIFGSSEQCKDTMITCPDVKQNCDQLNVQRYGFGENWIFLLILSVKFEFPVTFYPYPDGFHAIFEFCAFCLTQKTQNER
ncbi:hypothetical protein CRE_24837 [Caenorhabditis remanei]|uniref:Uncharacterized protein n=1 Tax=Caenorhabditis remanei TaxID=31234 RepID=E3NJ24_CAERE|nr:hypothetical protein CRE_24837 [Caenorhabditis remanei]